MLNIMLFEVLSKIENVVGIASMLIAFITLLVNQMIQNAARKQEIISIRQDLEEWKKRLVDGEKAKEHLAEVIANLNKTLSAQTETLKAINRTIDRHERKIEKLEEEQLAVAKKSK